MNRMDTFRKLTPSLINKRVVFVLVSILFVSTGVLLDVGGRKCFAQEETVKSLVSTTGTGNGWAINYPKQRKVFCMEGLLWVFYSDGADAVFRTSADGVNWSNPTTFGTGGHFGHRFSGGFDGSNFHYVLCTAAIGADVLYRRGKPNHDGTIAWSTGEQTVYDTPADKNVMYPKIMVDSEGCPWISFMQLIYQVPNTPPYDAIIIKASGNDGNWTQAPGFPFALVAQKSVAGYPDPVGVPLTAGKTFWFYNTNANGKDIYAARAWNGHAWEAEEMVVDPGSPYSFFNMVAEGDDVHVVHGAGTVKYQKRTWGSGWSDVFTVTGNASGHTSITRVGPDNVIVTWLEPSGNKVSYREMVKGKWEPSVSWIDEATDGLAGAGININTLVASSEPFKHAVVYSTGSTAPFKVKCAALMRPKAKKP